MRKTGFQTRSNTNRALWPQRMAIGFKFQIKEVEGLFYLCSENKGANELWGYCTADAVIKQLICVFVFA